MSEWKAGKFKRDELGVLRRFAPLRSVHGLIDITPEELITAGKKLVLVDVDNTLVEWRSEDIPESTLAWLGFIKGAGLKVCIISNTKKVARLKRLGDALDIPYLYGKFKPSRTMFLQALEMFDVRPEEAIMIGDQIFTDIWGANRSGIDAVWVKQMAPKDFVGTRFISRIGERLLRKRLHKVLEVDKPVDGVEVEEDLPIGGMIALLQSPAVKQFVKFCVVGGTSTVIDVGLVWYLRFYAKSGNSFISDSFGHYLVSSWPGVFGGYKSLPADASVPVFKVLSTAVATVNSFIWNRRWTFNIQGKEHRSAQFGKFFVLAISGLVLNAAIVTVLNGVIPGTPKESLRMALIIATVVVAFWNFFGQKFWTFKHKH
jgi:HAD superfamily phosphatase (TIGR01668 family)